MSKRKSKQRKVRIAWFIILMLGTGLACQLTSPRPASWAGTPTAEAWSTGIALTEAAMGGAVKFIFTPTAPTIEADPTPTPTVTPTPPIDEQGAWLMYPAPENAGLQVYNIITKEIIAINLPGPVITQDLINGRSPDGSKLIIRAGSPLNTDELALYQVNLPAFEVSMVSPLLSLTVQRKIVNEEGTRAFETLATVTRPDGLAWSPDGRFLAFSAALNNETSDLYVLDTLNDRIDRLNGLFTQNASPIWAPGDNWLISQELEYVHRLEDWRSELVTGLRVPTYDSQKTIYLPPSNSLEEVFVGWLNPNTFMSYSMTASGPHMLRQVNVDTLEEFLIFGDAFQQVAFDPISGVLAYILSYEQATSQGLSGGIYRLVPDSPVHQLQSAGNWFDLTWDSNGFFVATGTQGVTMFTPQGESMLLPGQGNARLSPNGNWLIAWGDGEISTAGARLYQPTSSQPLQTLIDEPVETLFWQPDSKAFFILSEGTLYQLAFPGLKPHAIIDGLPSEMPFEWLWVE